MKIALCLPVHGDTKALFTLSLVDLVARSLQGGLTTKAFLSSSANLPIGRTQLAGTALGWGADSILWLDADHTFPSDALLRLLAHNLDIVGCNYPRRYSQKPSATTDTTSEKADAKLIEPVDGLGMGLCLTSTEVFRKLPQPWFDAGWQKSEYVSEDFAFFRKARSHGFIPHVDHALSREVGHIAETVLRFP